MNAAKRNSKMTFRPKDRIEGGYIDKHISSFDYKEHQKQKQEMKEESMKKRKK